MSQHRHHGGAFRDDRDLMRRTRDGDRSARAALIERYLPLARCLAIRHRHIPAPVDDLIQVASLALVKAVDRWEPERGLMFSTYAVPTIVGELRRYHRDHTWAVRPPRHLLELAFAIERAREPLRAAIGRDPLVSDFALHLGQPASTIADALRAAERRWASSLDSPVADGEGERVGESIGGADAGYEAVEADVAFDALTAILDGRAREVLRLRFQDDLRQSDIADRVGCSQIYVSRIIHRALAELAAHVRGSAPCHPTPRLA
jgi:RNA polymerase sigma-B factor